MASKSVKIIIACLLGPLLAFVVVNGLIFLGLGIRIYQQRYVECDPNELLPTLEWVFDVNFPEDIAELKTAKTPNIDSVTLYIVKFSAVPNTVDSFLELYPGNFISEPYKRRRTFTSKGWLSPYWARRPIRQGRRIVVGSVRGTSGVSGDIYIETTDKEKFVVYMEGLYPTDAEERKENMEENRKD